MNFLFILLLLSYTAQSFAQVENGAGKTTMKTTKVAKKASINVKNKGPCITINSDSGLYRRSPTRRCGKTLETLEHLKERMEEEDKKEAAENLKLKHLKERI
jgi:hypothetical protein